MRTTFTDLEKRIIEYICVNYDEDKGINNQIYLSGILDDDLCYFNIFLEAIRGEKKAICRFDKDMFGITSFPTKEIDKIELTVLLATSLLEELQQNGLILLYKGYHGGITYNEPEDPLKKRHIAQQDAYDAQFFKRRVLLGNESRTTYMISDKHVTGLLFEYHFRQIIPKLNLITLFKNNFKSEEQIRHQEQMSAAKRRFKIQSSEEKRRFNLLFSTTWIGILISISISLAGFFYGNTSTKDTIAAYKTTAYEMTESICKTIEDSIGVLFSINNNRSPFTEINRTKNIEETSLQLFINVW